MTLAPPRPCYQRVVLAGGRGLIAVPLLAESLARPAYRPILQAVSRLAILKRLEHWIATKPRLVKEGNPVSGSYRLITLGPKVS